MIVNEELEKELFDIDEANCDKCLRKQQELVCNNCLDRICRCKTIDKKKVCYLECFIFDDEYYCQLCIGKAVKNGKDMYSVQKTRR